MTVATGDRVKYIEIQRNTPCCVYVIRNLTQTAETHTNKELKNHTNKNMSVHRWPMSHHIDACMFMSTKLHMHGHFQCFTMEHSHVYKSSNEICVCRVGAVCASSVSIQAYMYVCICMHQCTPASACMCIHSIYCVYRGDFKAKTP